jgi:tartrate dehydratase alpha subunit/fumarate hydratase class I-like protein
MKSLFSVLALVVALGFCSAMRAAEPSTAAGSNPSDTIRSFYRWYVTELIANRNPMENRRELRRFATERLLKEIDRMKKGADGLGGDYFLDAQDFDNLWAKNISVLDVKITGMKATAEVLLAGQGEMRRRLKVSLVKDGTVWKIDKVQGRE